MNINQKNNINKGDVNNIDNRGVANTAIDKSKNKKKGCLAKIVCFLKTVFGL